VLKYIKFRNENPVPNVMTILQGLGSPQEMLHTDEKWHNREFHVGECPRSEKRLLEPEVEDKWKSVQTQCAETLISCYNCPMKCGAIISVPGISTYMMKCFSKLTYAMAAFVDDLDFGFRIAQRARSTGSTILNPANHGLAFELREAGILTDADFAGCPSDNEGKFYWLLDRIVRREGSEMFWPTARIGRQEDREGRRRICP